jgi:hypothetical protein
MTRIPLSIGEGWEKQEQTGKEKSTWVEGPDRLGPRRRESAFNAIAPDGMYRGLPRGQRIGRVGIVEGGHFVPECV